MSVFIVSDNHINTILSYVNNSQGQKNSLFSSYNYNDLLKIGKMFIEANIESYETRYPKEKVERFEYELKLFPVNISVMQFIKYMNCLEYQCNEVENWESTEASKLINCWVNSAYQHLPEWQAAKWEIA
jgi:hypothetical protein